jgi:coenzyme Q-binding protein COQ10
MRSPVGLSRTIWRTEQNAHTFRTKRIVEIVESERPVKKFTTTRGTIHPADRMLDLVTDVARYPEFVPFVEKLEVLSRKKSGGLETIEVDMTIAFKVYRERVRTRLVVSRKNRTIDVENVDGPFESMQARWDFVPKPDGASDVVVSFEYEMRSRMLSFVVNAAFDKAFGTLVSAFEKRATQTAGAAAP